MSKYRDNLPKTDTLTPAQIIFQGKDLLTYRPEGMPYKDYRQLRGVQNKVISKLFPKQI